MSVDVVATKKMEALEACISDLVKIEARIKEAWAPYEPKDIFRDLQKLRSEFRDEILYLENLQV